MRFRIAVLIGTFKGGGIERAVLTFLRQIDRSRFETYLICYSKEGLLRRDFEALGIPIVVIPLHSWNMPMVIVRITKYVRQKKIGLLHSHSYRCDVVARIVARIANVPVVNTIHTNSTWKREPKGIIKHFHRFWDIITAKRYGQGFIALTESIRQFHIEKLRYPSQYWCVIPNPVDWERLQASDGQRGVIRSELSILSEDVMVLTIGNLLPIKGHRFLIEAVSLLKPETLEKTKVYIAGEGKTREDLEQRIKKLDLEGRVNLLGYRDDVGNLLSAADIFVLPSISEGQSLALLEAMAMKRPLLVTSQGAHLSFLKDQENAIIIEPGNSNALARGLEILILSKQTRNRLATRAWDTLQHLSIRQSVENQQEFYTFLIEKSLRKQ
jgi:glycosyltransferase involved in cell wall biosynthesis